MKTHQLNGARMLAKAIAIASDIHLKQLDKGGNPYILHPLHVMNTVGTEDKELAAIAVMHDVVEDSNGRVTLESLREDGFSDRVISGLAALTHDHEDDYLGEYIPKICTNPDAIKVKKADIEHNSCVTRLKGLRTKDMARLEKYSRAYVMLTEAQQTALPA